MPAAHACRDAVPVFAASIRKQDLQPLGPYLMGLIEASLRDEGFPIDVMGSPRSPLRACGQDREP
jgi:hypothetical protein